MKKKKYIKLIILILLVIVSNILVFKYCNLEDNNMTLSYNIVSDKQDTYQVYYGSNTAWTEEKSEKSNYKNIGKQETLKYIIPKDTKELRLDLGNQVLNMHISDIKLSYVGKSIELDLNQMLQIENQVQIGKIQENENSLDIETAGTDAYITYKLDPNTVLGLSKGNSSILNNNNILKIVICIVIDILTLMIIRKSKSVVTLIQELNNNRILIFCRSYIWILSITEYNTINILLILYIVFGACYIICNVSNSNIF